jgi:putative endonuclease
MTKGGWVYVMTNQSNGTLYVGVTTDIIRRVSEHRDGTIEGFTKKYGLKRLVLTEPYDDIETAIRREKQLKRWNRAWKLELIQATNPSWDDLYDRLV